MKYVVTIDGEATEIEVKRDSVRLGDRTIDAGVKAVRGNSVRSLIHDGASTTFTAERIDSRWVLHVRGHRLEADVVDERTHAIRQLAAADGHARGPKPLKAPMPGLVVQVAVEVGDEVEAGQGVVIVEAMKMENELRAEAGGVVSAVRVEAGDAVDKDAVLLEFEAP